jgi:radical SAM-linked protein
VPVPRITGPVGAGKSTVLAEAARLPREAGVPHAAVDLARVGAAWPAPAHNPRNERLIPATRPASGRAADPRHLDRPLPSRCRDASPIAAPYNDSMKAQRLRVTFSRGEPLRFISHLDLMRFWERALRRAGLAVAYSEGFSPHPQIALGSPLPVGTTGEAELMDVFLAEPVTPDEFLRRLRPQLPHGVAAVAAREVPVALPSLQSQLRAAEYRVTLPEGTAPAAAAAVAAFLARASVPWEHRREGEVRRYDLRPLVEWLRVEAADPPRLLMRLRADPGATGRPDQVAAALGFAGPLRVHRTALILDDAAEAVGTAAPGSARAD